MRTGAYQREFAMKFVDSLPPAPPTRVDRGAAAEIVAELHKHPGQWGEVGRYPHGRRLSATRRGRRAAERYPEVEWTVRPDGDEFVLYYRVPAVAS